MSRPRVAHIGHTRWRLAWTAADVRRLIPHDDEAGGACHHESRTIAVEPLDNPTLEREVLLHELLHACYDATSVPLNLDQEEHLVAIVAPRLLQLLRDNPTIVRYLTERV